MNYSKIYLGLYKKAKLRGHLKLNPFMEFHHFVPKSLYFSKYKKLINEVLGLEFNNHRDQENIYPVTLKEHYMAHLLLFKMFPDLKEIMYGLNQVMNRYGKSNDFVQHKKKIYAMISEANKGKVSCVDKNTRKYKTVTSEEFENSDILVGSNYFSDCNTIKLTCELCGYTLKGRSNLAQHVKYFCELGDRKVQPKYEKTTCVFCETELSKNSKADHERSCKSNPNRTVRKHKMRTKNCKYCGMFGTCAGINRHERRCGENINKITQTHSVKKTCELCGEMFHSRGLHSHMQKCAKMCKNTQQGIVK